MQIDGVSWGAKVRVMYGRGRPVSVYLKTLVEQRKREKQPKIEGWDGCHPSRLILRRGRYSVVRVTLASGQAVCITRGQKLVNGDGNARLPYELIGGDVMAYTKTAAAIAVERILGRPLSRAPWLYVKNGDPTDCRPENLEVADDVWARRKRRRGIKIADCCFVPRYEVRPVAVSSVELAGDAVLCQVVSRTYFANGILIAG